MPSYADPLDAAEQLPTGFKRYIDPTEAASRSLQYTGDQTGWQPYVSPQQATDQNLQYIGGSSGFVPAQSNVNPIERIRAQRDEISNQLQSTGNRFQQRQLYGALRALNDQERSIHTEAQLRRQMAHDSASEAHHQLSTDRNTEIDEQGHGLLNSMLQLDGALRRGEISKDDYDEGLLAAGQQFPLGTRHPEAARHFEFAITEADKQNAFNARRELTQVAKIGAKYGIDPQFDPETGRPSIALTQQMALQTPKGKNEALGMMNKEMAAKYGVTTGVGSLFNPIAPHVGTDESGNQIENPTHVAIPFQDQKTGAIGKLPVPVPLFNQMKADFNDRYFALAPQSAAQPAGAVSNTGGQTAPADNPRIALAQRALDDPNASEAHKAAARQILGIQ